MTSDNAGKYAPPATHIPIIPDHEVLRVIGRGAYGEIWLARGLTGALRAVKVVYRSTFDSERAFQREFQGMSSFEPISRAHAGFVDILHVGRTGEYLYYIMELADDHLSGREIDIINYSPRTLKSDLERRKRLSVSDSIALGLSLTDALSALHAHGLTHRDIKPANIIFVDGVPKLADIGLVAVSGQRSFVGTEGAPCVPMSVLSSCIASILRRRVCRLANSLIDTSSSPPRLNTRPAAAGVAINFSSASVMSAT